MNTNTEEVRKILKWGWIVLVVLSIFLTVEALGALKDLRSLDPTYNSISVSGEGEAVSVPDIATFSFTVSADAKVASDAQSAVTQKMNAILEDLKGLGIEEKDINTTDYSLWPKYTYQPVNCVPGYCPPTREIADGYTASHHVSIKVRDTEKVGEALAAAGDNGATGLSNISFTVDDPDGIVEEARAEAIANAQEKAKQLANELGVRLVRVVSFYDNSGGLMPYYAEGLGSDMARSAVAPAPTIPIGENKVRVNVTVIYEIR